MHLENHDYFIDSPSDQHIRSVTRRTSSNQSLRSLQRFDIDSLSQSSLSPIYDSLLRRPPSNLSISDPPSCCDRDSVVQQLSDSEVSSDDNESYSDSEFSSESTGGCGTVW